MLILLPFYFAIGFGLSYLLQQLHWSIWLWARQTTQAVGVMWRQQFGVPLLVIIALAAMFLAEEVLRALLAPRHGLLAASAVVGLLAGYWFRNSSRTREQLAFVAGAGAFLFLAALEYDYRLFAKLAKIGGSEFSVEFTDSGRSLPSQDNSAQKVTNRENSQGSSFPGATQIDFSLDWLSNLPLYIEYDSYYSGMFSGFTGNSPSMIDLLPTSTKQFFLYACKHVDPFANKLRTLQEYTRSETSVFALDPKFVESLRRIYYNLRKHYDLCAEQSADKECTQGNWTTYSVLDKEVDNGLSNYFLSAKQIVSGQINSLGLHVDDYGEQPCDDLTRISPYIGIETEDQQHIFPYLSINHDSYGLIGYLALVVSLAEVGAGGRESAVHLLEGEITSDRRALKSIPKLSPCTELNCTPVEQRQTLNYLQHLVLILRLELAQWNILKSMPSEALNLIRVRRLMQMVDDYEDALSSRDADGRLRESLLLLKTRFTTQRSNCAVRAGLANDDAANYFGRFWLAEITTMSNIFHYIGRDPSIVVARPEYMQKLDGFTREVELADIDCLARLGSILEKDVDTNKAIFLENLGSYWSAKGSNFGQSGDSEDRLLNVHVDKRTRIKALCDSKAAYSEALDFVKIGNDVTPQHEVGNPDDWLDRYLTADDADSFPLKIQAERAVAAHALEVFPQGDVDSVCNSAG